MMQVSRADITPLLGVSRRQVSRWVCHLQKLFADMLTTIKTLIRNAFDIDSLYLGGEMSMKMSYGRRRGALRYREKQIMIIQQRNSRHLAISISTDHESAEMADELATTTVAKKTPGFMDSGHSKISAWVHLEEKLEAPLLTCNHSIGFKDPETGAHSNFGENRNKLLRFWLCSRQGGGSSLVIQISKFLKNCLSEYLFYQWFTPGGSNEAVYVTYSNIFMLLFGFRSS